VKGPKTALRVKISSDEGEELESWQRSTMIPVGLVKRGKIILLLAEGRGITEIARTVGIARHHIYKWTKRFNRDGIKGLYRAPHRKIKKAENREIQSALFSILHCPPSDFGINRTSWRLADLKKCLTEKNINVSEHVIRAIIKNAGYKWRKAKIVLSSPDPEYRKKLNQIQTILSNISTNEHFFSIDEFGPFSVIQKGGKKLVAPDVYPYILKNQNSKGSLIITAALELSENQVTHFYSKKKNTAEMIKLLEMLLGKYRHSKTIYLSWDAASWHASKQLYERVEELNDRKYHLTHKIPVIQLVPLPKAAQFLNVIESVFSGMAKAIVHNSDYQSVDKCKEAIDKYFDERNQHYKDNPKRAGKKIWGKEIVKPVFKESNNCKDLRYDSYKFMRYSG
jgi:transposase